jgi:hypothetical protein
MLENSTTLECSNTWIQNIVEAERDRIVERETTESKRENTS